MRRRLIESIVVALIVAALSEVLATPYVVLIAVALLGLMGFWPILDRVVAHRRKARFCRWTRSIDPLDEAKVDYEYFRAVAHEAPTAAQRLRALRDCLGVVVAHSAVGVLLGKVKNDLARLIAVFSLLAAVPTFVVALSYYSSPASLFVEDPKYLSIGNGVVAASLLIWFIAAVMTRGDARHPLLVITSLTLSVAMMSLGALVGVQQRDTLTLVPGMSCFILGLYLFHLSGFGFASVAATRAASLVICVGAAWTAVVELHNGIVIEGLSAWYNVGLLLVGAFCVYLAAKSARLAVQRRPPTAVAPVR